ncbi:MAG: hypothetical protein K2G77_04315 [Muribaculaceae bacterium]|nr:hypothetical protein [Muribaculaceae bacterium]
MKTFYMKRSFMLLGAAALAASASADFVDVTDQYLKEPCYLPAWQGVLTGCGEGVGEVWNGAFRLYQVLRDLPAGDYTLTVDASYRCGNNDYAKANQEGNPELNTAYIFAGENKKTVKGLFEGGRQVAPNWLGEANEAFQNGEYVNTLSFKHEGGDLTIGIANTGCYVDEWCAFDNFKLVGPNGEVAIENGDFSTGIDSKRAWNNVNADGGEKTPDMQKDGAGGGTYRKCGGSPYNYGQQVTLPAGKYRWGMLTFHRYGSTQNPETGEYYHHKSGEVVEPYGRVPRTPKQWFEANDYDTQTTYDHAYLYVGFGENKPATLKSEDDFGDLTDKDLTVRIKDVWEICNGNVAEMPDNNPYGVANYNWDVLHEDAAYYASQKKNSLIYWHDSGDERVTAAAFFAEPEKYYQYVEFELPVETTVWVGMGKDSNTSDGYYQPWAYQTIKKYVEGNPDAVEAINTANGAVEYYNLQGVRVAQPENGIYIVREGNKVAKKVIR